MRSPGGSREAGGGATLQKPGLSALPTGARSRRTSPWRRRPPPPPPTRPRGPRRAWPGLPVGPSAEGRAAVRSLLRPPQPGAPAAPAPRSPSAPPPGASPPPPSPPGPRSGACNGTGRSGRAGAGRPLPPDRGLPVLLLAGQEGGGAARPGRLLPGRLPGRRHGPPSLGNRAAPGTLACRGAPWESQSAGSPLPVL